MAETVIDRLKASFEAYILSVRKDARYFIILGTAVALIDVLVPFLILKDIGANWFSYLFWILLTVFVILAGYFQVRRWGEE